MINVLGIDPGLSGALCLLNEEGIQKIMKMPVCTRPYRKGNYIDLEVIYNFIISFNDVIKGIYIERQFMLRSQGMSSGSKTMYQSGLLYGLCYCQCNNLNEVNAKDWQTHIFSKVDNTLIQNYNYPSYTKLQSIAYVEQYYNSNYLFTSSRQSKPSDGLADAICIAKYGLDELLKTKNKNKK